MTPYRRDLFFGLLTKLIAAAVWLAVSGDPSEQVTPDRSVNVADRASACHLFARPDANVPFG